MKIAPVDSKSDALSALVVQVERARTASGSSQPKYSQEVQNEVRSLVRSGITFAELRNATDISLVTLKRWVGLYSRKPSTKPKKEHASVRQLTVVGPSVPGPAEPVRIRFPNDVIVEIPFGISNADLISALVLGRH